VKFFTKSGYTGRRYGRAGRRQGYGCDASFGVWFAANDGEMARKPRSFSFSRSARSLQENVSQAGPVAGAAYTLVGGIILLGGIGYAIDRGRVTAPWFLVTGLFLGIVVGFYELVKTVYRR
jgi:F0F1-type ATP synthase assembly protein I